MTKTLALRKTSLFSTVLGGAALTLAALSFGCASDQNQAATAEEVANGEAIPAPPPVPAEPASTDSAATSAAPGTTGQAAGSQSGAASEANTAATPALETLSEAQAAKIADLANTAEVDQARVAQRKAKLPAVKKFADMMVKHHTESKQEQTKLFKKLNLTPADSATSASLKADGDKTLETLQKTEAANFDSVYVASQVEVHQKVLDAIDKQLIPAAKTPELAEGLKKMRTTVEAHLNEAKAIQSQVAQASTPTTTAGSTPASPHGAGMKTGASTAATPGSSPASASASGATPGSSKSAAGTPGSGTGGAANKGGAGTGSGTTGAK